MEDFTFVDEAKRTAFSEYLEMEEKEKKLDLLKSAIKSFDVNKFQRGYDNRSLNMRMRLKKKLLEKELEKNKQNDIYIDFN